MSSYKLEDVVYEQGQYWVLRVTEGEGSRYSGYDVYRTGITHSTRCAQIGYTGQVGLDKALAEVARRIEEDSLR